jgi:hypothetical protein
MRALLLGLLVLASPALGQEATSAYTKVAPAEGCAEIGRNDAGEGDWQDLVCPGVANYPYVLRRGDGRETVTYGFASDSGMPGFGAFNYANDTVEWRLVAGDNATLPVAAIQRWFLADQNGAWATQILVVSRVGQPDDPGACVVGYVAAADGPAANLRARTLADTAPAFRCGADRPTVEPAIAAHVPPG